MRNVSVKFFAVFFLALFAFACQEDALEADRDARLNDDDDEQEEQTAESELLTDVAVEGVLEDGSEFTGTITFEEFEYEEEDDDDAEEGDEDEENEPEGLLASGTIKGLVTLSDGSVRNIEEEFEEVSVTITNESLETASARMAVQQRTCDVLFLNLGPLSLDLLGLTLDLSEITLDVNAVTGSGNLLGNLLCEVAGLFDPLGNLVGSLERLLDLLDQINDIIG